MVWRISKAVDMFQYQLSIPQISDWLFQQIIKRFIQQKAPLELFLKLQKDRQSWLELTVEKIENETFTGFPRKLLLKKFIALHQKEHSSLKKPQQLFIKSTFRENCWEMEIWKKCINRTV